jgi:hypothetical protein
MANRAYLYVSDTEGSDNFRLIDGPPESWYYDSRHNVPPAWLFFFAAADVRLAHVQSWHQVRLVSPRLVAVERFHSREPLLRALLGDAVGWHWVEGFVRDIALTAGTSLILDPNEIVMGGGLGEDEEYADHLRTLLGMLDAPLPAGPLVRDWWDREASVGAADARLRLLGTTYQGREYSDYGFPDGYPSDDS